MPKKAETMAEQDERMRSDGYTLEGDYETPPLTDAENVLINVLASFTSDNASPKVAKLFEQGMSFDRFVHFFSWAEGEGVFTLYDLQTGIDHGELYEKIRKWANYHCDRDFIITDGGVIGEGKAFEADGVTIRPNWTRFYWK